MKFRKWRMLLQRLSHRKRNFYEDIIFESSTVSKKAKEHITKWMTDLHGYNQIEVKKFKDLFQLDEIIFPIRINGVYGRHNVNIMFIDNEGKEYYMLAKIYDYKGKKTYIIGRRNSPLESLVVREFYYKILEDGNIILTKTATMRLEQDGEDDNIVVDFYYDYEEHSIEAELSSYETSNKIRIKYPMIGEEFDKKVLTFLFDSKTTWYYYDVFPILRWIVPEISNENVSISITAKIEEKTFSEIDVVNGIVEKYTITEIINEGETRIIERLFSKKLREFLIEEA